MTNAGKFLSIALLTLFTVILATPDIPAQDGSGWTIPADTADGQTTRPDESPTGDGDDDKILRSAERGARHIEPYLCRRAGNDCTIRRPAYLNPLKTGPPTA